jgi:pheromone shutdown protein TraB
LEQETSYAGVNLLSKWYERNIHIFANLQRIAESGDRILVIIGSGHAPILRELITYRPEMLLLDVLEYLQLNWTGRGLT